MGKSLLESSQVFRSVIDECDKVLASLSERPNWTIRVELAQSVELSSINMPVVSQTACTALQIGLIEVWRSWGVVAKFVIGHSSGEIAACYAAGAYTLRDAILISYYRGKYVQEYQKTATARGAMCAVGLSEKDCAVLLAEINGYATIAAINSPVNCTISGDQNIIEELVAKCKKRGIFHKKLKVNVGKSDDAAIITMSMLLTVSRSISFSTHEYDCHQI